MFTSRTEIIRGLMVALVTVPAFVMTGCGSSALTAPKAAAPVAPPAPQPAQPTQITGTASLLPGAFGDLGNAVAAVYTSYEEWYRYQPVRFVRARGNGPEVSFTISGLVPGTYYLDVWKDTDNSARWSGGDFVGWVGNGSLGSPALTPFQVREGETVNVGDLFMYLIAPGKAGATAK